MHILSAFLLLFICNTGFAQNLPSINKSEKTFNLGMNEDEDTPLIFGYELPDTYSTKMICFSSATADVEKYQSKLPLGAYYTTDDVTIEYVATEGNFVKLSFKTYYEETTFYIEKKNISFE